MQFIGRFAGLEVEVDPKHKGEPVYLDEDRVPCPSQCAVSCVVSEAHWQVLRELVRSRVPNARD